MKKLIYSVLLFWLSALSLGVLMLQPVRADEAHVFGYSYHFNRSDTYCEDNPGGGYTADAGYSLVVFRNSYCNWTGFVNKRFSLWGENTPLHVAVRAGVFWSEDDYLFGWDVGPAATLEATFFDAYVVSFLGEAVSFHYTYKF